MTSARIYLIDVSSRNNTVYSHRTSTMCIPSRTEYRCGNFSPTRLENSVLTHACVQPTPGDMQPLSPYVIRQEALHKNAIASKILQLIFFIFLYIVFFFHSSFDMLSSMNRTEKSSSNYTAILTILETK